MEVSAEIYTSLLQHFARYFDACDRADIDQVMSILDGTTVVMGPSSITDPDVIRHAYESRQPVPLDDGRRQTKHQVSNLIVDGPDDDGVYQADVYYFRLEPGDEGITIATSGRLQERLRRSDSGWQVLQHSIVTDF